MTINHVLLEPLIFSHFPVMDLIGQPSEPHSIHRVPHQKKPNWHITMQSRCHRVQRIMNEILLNFKTLTSLSRHWPLGLPKSSYGTFATKWMRCFRKLLWRIFSNKYCSECSVRQGYFYQVKPSFQNTKQESGSCSYSQEWNIFSQSRSLSVTLIVAHRA